jgi:hypothetical protein
MALAGVELAQQTELATAALVAGLGILTELNQQLGLVAQQAQATLVQMD